jgi:hypothetical protein
MADEALPAIGTDHPPSTWEARLLCVRGIQATLGGYHRPMTLADLCALVAALPLEQFLEVAGRRLEHERLSEGHWMANWVDKAKAAHDALTAENARLRVELAHAREGCAILRVLTSAINQGGHDFIASPKTFESIDNWWRADRERTP